PASGGNSAIATASGETCASIPVPPRQAPPRSDRLSGLLLRRRGCWCRRRLGRVGRALRRTIHIELLHRHVGTGLLHRLLHALLDHFLAQPVMRLLEGRRLGVTLLLEL